jgi:SpoVK/Ycf46/Vps4 family AAA+-type ATPase
MGLASLARDTDGFSGADLAAIVREAGQIAILRGLREGLEPKALFLTPDDLMEALHAMRAKRLAGGSSRRRFLRDAPRVTSGRFERTEEKRGNGE